MKKKIVVNEPPLEPCPFCGYEFHSDCSYISIRFDAYSGNQTAFVTCSECGAVGPDVGPGVRLPIKQLAANAWNRRVITSKQDVVRELVRRVKE